MGLEDDESAGREARAALDAQLATLREEQAALRDKVRRRLAACHGPTLGPQMPPPPSAGNGQRTGGGPPHDAAQGNRGAMMRPPPRPIDPAMAAAAHSALQRSILSLLADWGGTLPMPARPDVLLRAAIERYAELLQFEAALTPLNVERALFELQGHAPYAVRVDRGDLVWLEPQALVEFRGRLMGGAAAGPSPYSGGPPGGRPGAAGPGGGPPPGAGGGPGGAGGGGGGAGGPGANGEGAAGGTPVHAHP